MKILQKKISEKHNDSFWYGNTIAKSDCGNYELIANGEIEIYDKDGLVHDGWKERNNGIDFKFENDDDLCKIGNNYDDKYYWEHNNWFEIIDLRTPCDWSEDVEHVYDDAILMFENFEKELITKNK